MCRASERQDENHTTIREFCSLALPEILVSSVIYDNLHYPGNNKYVTGLLGWSWLSRMLSKGQTR